LPIEEGSKLALSFYFSPTQLIKFGEGFILLFVAGAQIINTFLSLLFHESGGFDFIWHAIITALPLPAYLFWEFAIPFFLICNTILFLIQLGRLRKILHILYLIWLFLAFLSSLYESSGLTMGFFRYEMGFWSVPIILFLAILIEILLFVAKMITHQRYVLSKTIAK
jgi:hypothetical protein